MDYSGNWTGIYAGQESAAGDSHAQVRPAALCVGITLRHPAPS